MISKMMKNNLIDSVHNQNQFDNFKKNHNKKYDSELEHKERLHIFRNNLRLDFDFRESK